MKTALSIFIFLFAFSGLQLDAQTGKKKGKVTTYYEKGKKESSGKVKNYKKQGTWKYWDEQGNLVKTIQFTNDQKNGLYTEYFKDGKISTQGNYQADLKTGTWTSYYQGGKKSSELNYANNQFNGLEQWWYEDGNLREQSTYENGVIVSRYTWYYGGKKKAIETYKNGLAEGTWRLYPDPADSHDTLPASVDEYSGGKRTGVHRSYANGRLSDEIHYQNDKLDGEYKKWDNTGNLGVSENYKGGVRDGLCRYFNRGKLIREATYSNGKINGTEKEYYNGSEPTRISWYYQGRLDSVYTYFSNGKPETTRVYRYLPGFVRTEEFSVYTEYDSTGHKLLRGGYHFEAKNGMWTTFYPDGKIKSETPYDSGKIKGTYKKWYANGKPLIEMECDGNTVVAPPKIWDEKGKLLKPGSKQYQELLDSSKPGEVYNDPNQYHLNRTQLLTDRIKVEPPPVQDDAPPPLHQVDEVLPSQQQNVQGEEEPEQVFTYVEEQPEFPGGNDSLQAFLKRNIHYPQMEKEMQKQGTVFVTFVVENDGSITDVKVAKEVPGAPGLSKEAVRVVSSMPKWKPGKMNGRAVRVQYTMPVKFVLQ